MDEKSFKEAIQDAKTGEELMDAFVGRVGEDKEQARALLQRYKETVKGLPTVAKAAIQLGYGKVIAEIDQRFADAREIGQQGLANEMGVNIRTTSAFLIASTLSKISFINTQHSRPV